MLYIGEHLAKLSEITDPSERKAFYLKHKTLTLAKYYRLIKSDVEWRDCLLDVEFVFDPEPYGRNVSNLHKDYKKMVYFTVGMGYDYLPNSKVIEMYEKLIRALHHDEASLIQDIIHKRFILDNAFEGEMDWVLEHANF